MKTLTAKKLLIADNAWGQTSKTDRQIFEIEDGDVGTVRPHYNGMHHANYTFRRADVGKRIEVITSPGYTSWHWSTRELSWWGVSDGS